MEKDKEFSAVKEQLQEQNEVPVFSEAQLNVFYSGYVDSLDEATNVLEEETFPGENDLHIIGHDFTRPLY